MQDAKLRLASVAVLALSVASLGLASSSSGQSKRQAKDLLFQSLRRSFEINVIAIVEQRAPAGTAFQFKILQNDDGAFSSTVLRPLSQQGRALYDDGEKSYVLHPDRRVMVEQASARRWLEDAAQRQALTLKNYDLTMGQTTTVAGRSAISVVATPKAAGLPVRQVFMDEKTLFPLRIVIVPPNGPPQVRLETKMIAFPGDIPTKALSLEALGQMRHVKNEFMAVQDRTSQVLKQLGFAARIPRDLPLGFVTQAAEVHRDDDGSTLVLRLTDGLAQANVFERLCGESDGISLVHTQGQSTFTYKGVAYTVFCDLPQSVRGKLLAGVAGVNYEWLRKFETAPVAPQAAPNYYGSGSREPNRKHQTLPEDDDESPATSAAANPRQPVESPVSRTSAYTVE